MITFVHFFFHQYNALSNSLGNVLDLFLSYAPLDPTILAENPLVPVDAYHPLFKTKFCLSCRPSVNRSSAAYCYSRGNYLGLYKFMEQYDWSDVLNNYIADSATETLTSIVKNAMNVFIPKRFTRSSHYPCWISKELKIASRKKLHCHRLYKKTGLDVWYQKFSIYRGLVKKLYDQHNQLYRNGIEHNLKKIKK